MSEIKFDTIDAANAYAKKYLAINHHTVLLNALIEKYALKSYLEIGVQRPANNFDRIVCDYKVGVDPEITQVFDPGKVCTEKTNKNEVGDYLNWYELNNLTSDEFFNLPARPRRSFQLIFIDGLHHADQVKRDFENSLLCLSDNGFIVIHDVLPENEEGTLVPRQTRRWWGSAYQFAMGIGLYDNVEFKTFNIDEGCMVINKSKRTYTRPQYGNDWASYLKYNRSAMNVVDEVVI